MGFARCASRHHAGQAWRWCRRRRRLGACSSMRRRLSPCVEADVHGLDAVTALSCCTPYTSPYPLPQALLDQTHGQDLLEAHEEAVRVRVGGGGGASFAACTLGTLAGRTRHCGAQSAPPLREEGGGRHGRAAPWTDGRAGAQRLTACRGRLGSASSRAKPCVRAAAAGACRPLACVSCCCCVGCNP
jgi:hypothetical protein